MLLKSDSHQFTWSFTWRCTYYTSPICIMGAYCFTPSGLLPEYYLQDSGRRFYWLGSDTPCYWKAVYDLHVISSKCCHHLSLFTQLSDPMTFTDKHYPDKYSKANPPAGILTQPYIILHDSLFFGVNSHSHVLHKSTLSLSHERLILIVWIIIDHVQLWL